MHFWPFRALRAPSSRALAGGQSPVGLAPASLAFALASLILLITLPALAQTVDDEFLFDDEGEAETAEEEIDTTAEAEAELHDDAALGVEAPPEAGRLRRAKGIEELKVTGRKRDELLQEVPASVRAFGSQEIEQRNLQRIDEIGFATANLQFTGANGSARDTRIYIRGIGSADPRSIRDPGVGLYIDNVYIPRATNALFDVLDLERIDVLRGPQGTLFGKNTVGGLVNVITKKPGQQFGGDLRLNVGSFDMLETRASVDVPITWGWFDEKLFTRWTVATATDDGYLTNIYDNGEAGDNKLLYGRFAGTLLATESLTVNTTFDWMRQNENNMVGRCRIVGQESAVANEQGDLSYGPYVIARYIADNFVSRDDFGNPPGYVEGEEYRFPEACAGVDTLDRFEGYANPLIFFRQDTYGTSLDMDYNVADAHLPDWLGVNVRNVSGFRLRKEDNGANDFDGTPVEYIELGALPSRHYAVSSDLTATFDFKTPSPDVGVRVIAGIFGFYENEYSGANGNINRDISLGTNADFNAETFGPTTALVAVVNAAGTTGKSGNQYLQDAIRYGNGELNVETTQDWNNLSIAGYAHAEVDLFEDWSVTGGLRYSWERKERSGDRRRILCGGLIGDTSITDPSDPNFDPSQFEVLPNPLIAGGVPILNPPDRLCNPGERTPNEPVILDQDDSWTRLTPEAGVKYQINQEMMSYFRYAQGWKSGGFNREALTDRRAEFTAANGLENTFEPEIVNSFEVGYKSSWLDDQIIFNVALFWNNYDDLQLTSIEPDENGLVSANVRNAADAVTRGFEIEATTIPDWEWLPLPNAQFILSTGLGFTDAYYKQYTARVADSPYPINPQCESLRRVQGADPNDCNGEIDTFVNNVIIAGVLQGDTTSSTVDLSNREFANVPKVNFNVSAIYAFDVFEDLRVVTNVRYYYQTEIYFNVENSPNLYQPGYGFLDGSISLEIDATNTRIDLWGKNLTNSEFLQGGFSFGPALGADGVYVGRPLSFGMTLTQSF